MLFGTLLLASSSLKKQLYLAATIVLVTLLLPVMAVYALGSKTLSVLSSSPTSQQGYITTMTQGVYEGPPVSGDYYAWGNCTWWVYLLRVQAGDPIPTSWGNAATWAYYASQEGYQVDHTPTPGSIMQTSTVDNGLGHVAYVESVDASSGDWTISEMNVEGLDIVDTKTLPASDAASYNFIHDKGEQL